MTGMYIAASPETNDVIILLGSPSEDIRKLCARGSLRAKPVGPGVNLEKSNGRLAGIRLYSPVPEAAGVRYQAIGRRELRELQALTEQLGPTVTALKRKVTLLTKSLDKKK